MERIFVAVRARPLSMEESESSPWMISGNSIFLNNQSSKFMFDRVYGEDCKTVDIFESRTKEIVASVVRGFNGTVFAYGQTSSGKTYTMRGSAKEPGIIPLSIHELFCCIQEEMDREFLLRISYMEIYNEDINDLLAPEHKKLQIHESLERGIYVAGLKEEIVNSPEQVLKLVEFGESHRHIGKTNMNLYSSRSHTIFRMIVESRGRSIEDHSFDCFDAVRVSALNLVDLAGSERAGKTGAEGMRLKEGSHINKSLMTLGTVIKKLSDGVESLGGHVPYRDSKLTRILQSALGGNANTAMICNIIQSQMHTDETKSTLQFASRALQVKNCAIVNEILTDAALLKRQKKEIEELRTKLLSSHSEHLEEEILNLRNTLLQSELEKERIVLELEEEKKAKAHRERRLLEQAKKIDNLSSLILCSERDDRITYSMKRKRRLTWCPGPFQNKQSDELLNPEVSVVEPFEGESGIGSLHPFIKLIQESEGHVERNHSRICSSDNGDYTDKMESFSFLDAHVLLNVTSRRKNGPSRVAIISEGGQSVEKIPEFADICFEGEGEAMDDSLDVKMTAVRLNLDDYLASATENNPPLKEKYKEEQGLQHDMEKDELLSQVLYLQKEVSRLSSSSLAQEKEALRKELDKCKSKLKDTDCKLKNLIQDKVKLEGEKSLAERETKSLQGQLAILERDILKHDAHLDRRHELKSDFTKVRGLKTAAQQNLQDNYEKLELMSFEMEADISSLKMTLDIMIGEKEEAFAKNCNLSSELKTMANKLSTAYFEIESLKEQLVRMEHKVTDSESSSRGLEDSLDFLSRKKDEMILQLTEALLEVEVEKSGCASKEKTLNEKLKRSNIEIVALSKTLSEVKKELLCKGQCNDYRERLILLKEIVKCDKNFSLSNSSEIGHLNDEFNRRRVDSDGNKDVHYTCAEMHNVKNALPEVIEERERVLSKVDKLRNSEVEIEKLEGKYDELQSNAELFYHEMNEKISSFEAEIQEGGGRRDAESSELRRKLESTQAKLDAYRRRLKEASEGMKAMDAKYEEASSMLKDRLRSYGHHILHLTKQLAEKC